MDQPSRRQQAGSDLTSIESALEMSLPLMSGGRLRKRWRYVGIFSRDFMLCVGQAQVGPFYQSWWAIFDRHNGKLIEKTRLGKSEVQIGRDRFEIASDTVAAKFALTGETSVEIKTPSGKTYTWTRKTTSRADGFVEINGTKHEISERALIDDSAGFHPRHTQWHWSAGFGVNNDQQLACWNFVRGINDNDAASEQSVWIDDVVETLPTPNFSSDLSTVSFTNGDLLHFTQESERRRSENLLVIRSNYRQPFGTFQGEIPGVGTIEEGFGVMEFHDAHW